MFKKLFTILLLCILSANLTACGGNETPQPTEPEPVIETIIVEQVLEPPVEAEPEGLLPGRIAIVTNIFEQNAEEYISARHIQDKFGAEYIIHRTWPVQFAQEGEMMIEILQEIADDPDVRVLIINQAVMNTNAAVEAFRERRDDVFIIYVRPMEVGYFYPHRGDRINQYEITIKNADLILNTNNAAVGYHLVNQAIAMGAETIIHYSSLRHMAVPHLAVRRDGIRDAAEAAGIAFYDLDLYDRLIQSSVLIATTQDVDRRVNRYGTNIVFISTFCRQQAPIMSQVIRSGALYILLCCPSPFHTIPNALGLASCQSEALNNFSSAEIIEAAIVAIAEHDMTGRIATSPLSDAMLFTYTAVEYGIKWMHGEVSKDEIDLEVLSQIMADIIAAQTGVEGLGVQLARHEFEGEIFSNFILVSQDFLVY